MRMKANLVAITLIALTITGLVSLTLLTSPVFAHRSGCHRWHSCPSDSGSYSCGDTGYSNYCTTPTYNVYTPTITTKDEVVDEDIPTTVANQDNSNEYIGFKKLITDGSIGRQTATTSVTYTDGVESSRSTSTTSIVTKPVDTVYEVGTRVKPTAYIDYLSKSDNQSFWSFMLTEYDISASANPGNNYALMKNDQVIRLGKSTNTGMLSFDNVGMRTGDKLTIGTYTGDKFLWFMPSASKVSETSAVDTKKLTVVSEYDSLHNKTSDRTNEKITIGECTQDIKDKYIKSMDKYDKKLFGLEDYTRIYYTEMPCDIKTPAAINKDNAK